MRYLNTGTTHWVLSPDLVHRSWESAPCFEVFSFGCLAFQSSHGMKKNIVIRYISLASRSNYSTLKFVTYKNDFFLRKLDLSRFNF
jgi:hypothetical protein